MLPQVEEISLYDLNSHPILQYSLGDHVLIRPKLLPPTGIVEEVVSLATVFVEGLVRTVAELGEETQPAHQRTTSGFTTDKVDWMGEVVKINTDGTVKVRLAREAEPPPNWSGERYAIVKGEDLIVFEVDDENEEEVDDIEAEWTDDEFENSASDDEWEDASEGEVADALSEASLDGMDEVEPTEGVVTNGNVEEFPSPMDVETAVKGNRFNNEKCPGFEILETVPNDHPFKSDNPSRTGNDWIARIRKEHRILQTSLPGKSLGCRSNNQRAFLSVPTNLALI
jgi:hypothetical protein